MEGIIILLGMCITFVPVIFFVRYLMIRISKVTEFDEHVNLVKDKKGSIGVAMAYINKIMLACTVTNLGVFMCTYKESFVALEIFVISFVLYIICNYLDNYNEK